MSTPLTASELAFEHWCRIQGIEYRRVREAKAQGHKRPDYAMRVIPHRCFVEIKELAETPADVAMMHELLSGKPSLRWIDPGARLRQSIKDSAAQLRKFSYRGFPTVVCFFDTIAGFHLERVHVAQAMFGRETLHFERLFENGFGMTAEISGWLGQIVVRPGCNTLDELDVDPNHPAAA